MSLEICSEHDAELCFENQKRHEYSKVVCPACQLQIEIEDLKRKLQEAESKIETLTDELNERDSDG